MEQIYLDRLAKVIEAVEALPAKHFDLTDWICGTHCCAVGAYCRFGQSDGLYLDEEWDHPTDGNNTDWVVVEKHFGLSRLEAELLFYSQNYPPTERRGELSRRAVVARIRTFIEKHSPRKERKIMEHKPTGKVETYPDTVTQLRAGKLAAMRRHLGLTPRQLMACRISDEAQAAALENHPRATEALDRLLDAVEAAPIPPLPAPGLKPNMSDKIAEAMGEHDSNGNG